GQDVTFTATVSPPAGGGFPTGSVTFTMGATTTIVPVDATGVATVTTAGLLAGDTIVTAAYSGDSALAPSSGTVTQTVAKNATTTVVVSSANPSTVGGPVTFTATVSPVGVQGAVLFTVDGVTTGAFLVGNQATLTTSALAVGGHTVSAAYSGDAAFLASTSPTITQTVGPVLRLTTTTVTSNRVPTARLGQSVTFTATVRPGAGTGTPTGTVQVSIDGVNVGGIQTVNAQGRVTYTTATLSAGSHTVVASYGGSATFAGSGSATFTQLVNTAASATAVTSSVNRAVSGQTVTFTARVTPAAAVGSVQFLLDGANVGGPVTLDATGRATWVTNALTVGAHTVSAVYSGSVNYSPSTSANRAQTVNMARSRTTVVSSGTPALFQSSVVFTATVAVRAPGAGIPTGTVQFRIDGVDAGPAIPVNSSGQAAYVTNLLTIGRHTVTAVYSGDGNVSTSTSGAITQRIQ
ncbi:MAG: Ig-like domain-containing protein, partial [Cellulomonas sp.]